ncbi:VCBS repeat-containing protein [Halocynthiibacter sp. SDUM655004]|uniref:VCBS repeat-containing protein n=1 Tax=Halocynthiibacter halioticoli TaxID=2986804 RepID=A0AAE3IZM1_9RHOB|nr:VCBS repeat-containing protein [Halocynthiibacter halioticoli]MCW4056852.1 VCBS repeat-containing protein [Halocynthiibacter sp. SDUM655004]
MRRAALGFLVGVALAAPAWAEITAAQFVDPTGRYGHGVLGDAIEYGALEYTVQEGGKTRRLRITLPQDHVFEDIAPRLADVDGDGLPEIIVVETDMRQGAALAIYGVNGKITETPHIGQSNRWLAPVGVADLDGDGAVELSYVDRPHLARVLTVWRFQDGALEKVATQTGHTNHSIGQDYITGGVRTCGGVVEMITLSPDWSRIYATRLIDDALERRDIGPNEKGASVERALDCNF